MVLSFRLILSILIAIIRYVLLAIHKDRFDSKKKTKEKVKPEICNTDYKSDDISLVNMTDPLHVANYFTACDSAPPFYITKEEAKKAKWKPKKGNLQEKCPKKVIGGDLYKCGTKQFGAGEWFEYDVKYTGGYRGDCRLIVNENCLTEKKTGPCGIKYSPDHLIKTFIDISEYVT